MRTKHALLAALCVLTTATFAASPDDGSVLPFPPTPSASKAGQTLQDSVHKRRVEPERLPKDAPNVLIVLVDDALSPRRAALASHANRSFDGSTSKNRLTNARESDPI